MVGPAATAAPAGSATSNPAQPGYTTEESAMHPTHRSQIAKTQTAGLKRVPRP
jgi:hypothetical protein